MTSLALASTLLSLILGALGWSLSEYWIHRELGHNPKRLKNPFGTEHITHHGKGNYFAPRWKKVGAAVGVAVLLIGPSILLAGLVNGIAFVVGFVGFYLCYELLHYREHIHEGFGSYGRWARRHHFWHHFHNPRSNHGVTSPLWDHIFGTYEEPGVVFVPEKLAMVWLRDDATGDVHPHLRQHFEVRRAPRRAA